jgi:16S rRNA (cytidine1402-2'-O)-methyltransferase
VAFESPLRLPRSLKVLARAIPDRPAAVCRELTKRFEEVARGSLSELADRFAESPKGEVTLVVGAADVAVGDEGLAGEAMAELVAAGLSRRGAANLVARLTGIPRNRLYRSSL